MAAVETGQKYIPREGSLLTPRRIIAGAVVVTLLASSASECRSLPVPGPLPGKASGEIFNPQRAVKSIKA